MNGEEPPEEGEDVESKTLSEIIKEQLEKKGHGDIELSEELQEYGPVEEIPQSEINSGIMQETVYKSSPNPGGDYTSETLKFEFENGLQFNLNIEQRPECPGCGDFLETDVNVRCGFKDCEKHICEECRRLCDVCSKPLCSEHTARTPDDEVVCGEHAD